MSAPVLRCQGLSFKVRDAELLQDSDQKISRPMQWYTGADARDYVAINKR